MKKIGMLVAIEIDSVLSRYGEPSEKLEYPGFTVFTYKNDTYTIYALSSGAGEIAAAAGTQFLITALKVDMILNFGVVGGLTEKMAQSTLCVVDRVVHYDYDASAWTGDPVGKYPGYADCYIPTTASLVESAVTTRSDLWRVTCASADKFVDAGIQKSTLHERFGADICDMESAGIVLTCNQNNIPCLLIKAVSDSLMQNVVSFNEALERVGGMCLEVADQIIRNL